MNWILVFIGGGLGSMVRVLFSQLIHKQNTVNLPLATLIANLVSCLTFGIVYSVYIQRGGIPSSIKMLLLAGFCGGLSTFSTFSYETVELVRRGDLMFAIANVLVNVALCFAVMYFCLGKSA
jgi:fluoride exporter